MKKILKFTLLLIFPFNILFAAPTSNNKGNETWEIQFQGSKEAGILIPPNKA